MKSRNQTYDHCWWCAVPTNKRGKLCNDCFKLKLKKQKELGIFINI